MAKGKKESKSEKKIKAEKKVSQLMEMIEKQAKSKGISVEKFMDEYKDAIAKLRKNYKDYFNKAIDDIAPIIEARDPETFVKVNGEEMTNVEAIFELEHFRNKIRRIDKSVMQITMDFGIDLDGNIFINLPEFPEDIEEADLDDIADYFKDNDITLIISDKSKNPNAKNRLYPERKSKK